MPFAVVKLIPLGASAQFPPEVEVTNSRVLQGKLQRFVIELRGVLGVRLRTRVHDHLNGMRLQQAQEVLHGMVGMSNGKDARAGGSLVFHLRRHARARQFNTGMETQVVRGKSGGLPAPADRLPQSGSVQVFAQVH